MSKTYQLKNGKLELSFIHDNKLVLARYAGKSTYDYELVRLLKQAGISHGYIQKSISMLQSGIAGQLPIAQARLEDEPPDVTFLFETLPDDEALANFVRTGLLPEIDFMNPVQANHPLLKISTPSRRVIKYPNGQAEVVKAQSENDLQYFASKNTKIDKEHESLIPSIDGSASRNVYGMISVAPRGQIRSLGKAHGQVYYETALTVQSDVRTESELEITSNLKVNGVVRSSKLEVAGNTVIEFGLDNPGNLEMSQVRAGGSLFANSIRNYQVFAGEYLLAKVGIDNSKIFCLNRVACPRIRNSEIRVRSKLFVHNLDGKTTVYLGPDTLVDYRVKENTDFQKQHEKRLIDLEKEMAHIRDRLNQDKKGAVVQLNKLKRIAPDMLAKDLLLNRHYHNHVKELAELDKRLRLYNEQCKIVAFDRAKHTYYERQMLSNLPPEIIVTGTVEAGCTIHFGQETLKIDQTMSAVKIQIDPQSNQLRIQKIT